MNRNMNTEEALNFYRLRAARKKRRRAREIRMQVFMLTIVIFCAAVIAALWVSKTEASAETENVPVKEYTSVMLEYGENVYDLAEKYSDPVYYANRSTYIREVLDINHLPDVNSVHPGDYVICPYYLQ